MARAVAILAALAVVTSCGGGGGGGSSAPAVVQVTNTAPTISDPGALSLLEGGTAVATISASDAQNNSLSFSIASGDDKDLFSITAGGALSFAAAPDFEAPADSDTDNVYDVTVQVSDGSLTDTQALTITVTDAFEGRVVDAPIAGASVFVDLNGNNAQDADEPSGVTDDSGFFNVDTFTPPEGVAVKVISKGGTDTKTGKALPDLALISDVPADITKPANVTPLTTVVASVDTPEAKAQVLLAMGIDKTPEELLTTDNWAAAEAGDESAKAAQRVNQQVGLLLQTAATVADDGDEATDISVSLAKAVAAEISTVATSDAGIDFTSADTLTTVLSEAVAEVAPTVVVEAAAIAAVASSVATVNLVVADPTLDPLSDVAADIVQSAQEDLQTSVADVVSGELSVEAFETATDTTELFSEIVIAVDALDTDKDGVPDALDTDDDGDGVADGKDAFSLDATETLDTDGDLIGNNADPDDDNDGVADASDALPLDKTESIDTDGDRIGNNADTDDDGDGVLDTADAFPLDKNESIDTDGDLIGNNADTDDDGDSVLDTADAFPLDKTETLDTDADGVGNNTDTDDDGDSVLDTADAFPLDKTETIDTDGDGTGNNADTDDDNDGTADADDAKPLDAFPWDTELSVAKTIDKTNFPSSLLIATANPDSVWQYAASPLVGRWLGLIDDATSYYRPTARLTKDIDADYELGTWSFGTNSVLSSHTLPYNSGYTENNVNRTSTVYTNIDWSAFESAKGVSEGGSAQISLTLKYDRELWLIDSDASTSKYTFYQKYIVSYYVASGEGYAADASLPVRTDEPVYVKLTMYDMSAKSNLPFTAKDLVSGDSTSWAMPISINEKVGDSYRDPSANQAIKSDIATFNSDGTGSTKLGGKTFVWEEMSEDLRNPFIKVTYADGSMVYLYKWAEGTEHIGLRVVAVADGWRTGFANTYAPAVKMDETEIAIEGFLGKTLLSAEKENPSDALSDKYEDSFGATMYSDGTAKTQYGWDVGGAGTGWQEVPYFWEPEPDTSTIYFYSCKGANGWQDSDSDGVVDTCPTDGNDYLRFRNVEVLKATANGLWLNMEYTLGVGGTVAQAKAGNSTGLIGKKTYTAFWQIDEKFNDFDSDGVANTSDTYPFIAISGLLDTDSDGAPDTCDAACTSLGMAADTDDDGDGALDTADAFPLDKTESLDTDADGIGNNADTDDDADGVLDTADDYPLNANVHTAPTTSTQSLSLNLLPQTTNALTGAATSTSQDSRAVSYSIVSNGSLGTATITNSSTGAFSYATTSTVSGNDSFTYKVNDGYVDSTASTITVQLKTDPLYKYQWHLDNTGQTSFADNAGTSGGDLNVAGAIVSGRTGSGVIVAVVDSGLEIAHEDISENVVSSGSWNFSTSATDPTPLDSSGDHGTSVAGIIAAKGWNDLGGRGVAPNAKLKAFNLIVSGNSGASNEAKSLGGSTSNPNSSDVSIFNMSYAGSQWSSNPANIDLRLTGDTTVADQLLAGATNLRDGKGGIYVYAVGNDYDRGATGSSSYSYCGDGINNGTFKIGCYDTVFDPIANSPYLIGVAALNADKTKASYSTPGAANWVSAPGGEYGINSSFATANVPYKPAILTTDQSSCSKGYASVNSTTLNAFVDNSNRHPENTNCNYTNTFNGTSSAAPNVAGVVALMLEANSNLTWRDVKHILATTAVQVDPSFSAGAVNTVDYVGWVNNDAEMKFHSWYGFGAVDATAAVNAATSHTSLTSHTLTDWRSSEAESGVDIGEGSLFTRTINESGSGTVEHIQVRFGINHATPNQLGFRLESPAGTIATLLPPFTVWQKNPTTDAVYWAHLSSNAFYGEEKSGTWKLHVYDHVSATSGAFNQWSIKFMYR